MTICKDVYMVGGSGLSHPNDCSVYLIDAGDLVLIDCGAGDSYRKIIENIESLGLNPSQLKAVLVTHRHIDHIGSLKRFREDLGAQIIAHELDSDGIEIGIGTGADVYGVGYEPCHIDLKITDAEYSLQFGKYEVNTIHIPGHTSGSIAAYMDTDDGRILFGQDIHGPYLPQWGGDRNQARISLQKLIDLKADILCEGHFGVYQPASDVEAYIRGYLNSL
jgi:glyoxylase-like metal-dependent hydrolase (beta-lactamase superfamily II)